MDEFRFLVAVELRLAGKPKGVDCNRPLKIFDFCPQKATSPPCRFQGAENGLARCL